MKRIIAAMLVCILLLPMLAGCCLSHDWQAATCQAPETCAKCGKTQGEILPHNWEKATCEKSETCTQCGATQGDPLGHDWQAATCEAPETCANCGKTQGEALGHPIQPETIEEGNLLVGTCTNCNTVVQEAFVWEEGGLVLLSGDWECVYYQLPNGNISFPKEGDHIEFFMEAPPMCHSICELWGNKLRASRVSAIGMKRFAPRYLIVRSTSMTPVS